MILMTVLVKGTFQSPAHCFPNRKERKDQPAHKVQPPCHKRKHPPSIPKLIELHGTSGHDLPLVTSRRTCSKTPSFYFLETF